MLARGQAFRDLQAIIFQAFFQFPLSFSFSLSAELVRSSHLLPGYLPLVTFFLLSSRAWLRISGQLAVPVILISVLTLSLSFTSILSPLPIMLLFRLSLRCTSLPSAIVEVYSHSPSAIVPRQRCRNWSIGERFFGKAGRIEELRL